jgi:hypothetical protein
MDANSAGDMQVIRANRDDLAVTGCSSSLINVWSFFCCLITMRKAFLPKGEQQVCYTAGLQKAASFIFGIFLVMVMGCSQPLSTREKSTLAGGGIGAVTGTVIGAAVGAPGAGAAIGGALGAAGGALTGDQLQKRDQELTAQQRDIEAQRREIRRQREELERAKQAQEG